MELTQEQIENLATKLSKLSLKDEKLSNNIKDILKYIDLLNEIDTTWVESTISVVEKKHILRNDIEEKNTATPKELLECSNQKVVADQIAVSNIMK